MGAALVAFVAAVIQTVRLLREKLARALRARANRVRARRAAAGEIDAEPLLGRAGYEVLARQVPGRWTVFADGEPCEIAVRADLIVQRGGRRYVAEVKTGRLAPRLDHAPTRRQLLEYSVAFEADGVLLVDADEGRVTVVDLPTSRTRARARGAAWMVPFVLGLALGAAFASWMREALGAALFGAR
jgi:hypothetical protein